MRKIFSAILLLSLSHAYAQNDRVNDFNNINWLQTFNTFSLNKKWSIHLEYQWRRENGLKDWQQSLLRTGVNVKLNEQVTAHVGYGLIHTFAYGDYPVANAGTFPEHRLYEQLTMKQAINKWSFIHRFRVEQRWLRRKKSTTEGLVNDWYFLHRFRYQFRTQYPLWASQTKQLYAAAADELFIGAGKNLGTNIFDQNRIFLLLGYKLNKKISLEAGYFNQTVQQGKRVNDKTIMQRNNGIVFSSFLNL